MPLTFAGLPGSWSQSQLTHVGGYTIDRSPVCHKASIRTTSQTCTYGKFSSPNVHVFGLRRKLENPEKTHSLLSVWKPWSQLSSQQGSQSQNGGSKTMTTHLRECILLQTTAIAAKQANGAFTPDTKPIFASHGENMEKPQAQDSNPKPSYWKAKVLTITIRCSNVNQLNYNQTTKLQTSKLGDSNCFIMTQHKTLLELSVFKYIL